MALNKEEEALFLQDLAGVKNLTLREAAALRPFTLSLGDNMSWREKSHSVSWALRHVGYVPMKRIWKAGKYEVEYELGGDRPAPVVVDPMAEMIGKLRRVPDARIELVDRVLNLAQRTDPKGYALWTRVSNTLDDLSTPLMEIENVDQVPEPVGRQAGSEGEGGSATDGGGIDNP
jgi:hypothetical protein